LPATDAWVEKSGALVPAFNAAMAGAASTLERINPIAMVFTTLPPGGIDRLRQRSGF
jgi:hypothetical protein